MIGVCRIRKVGAMASDTRNRGADILVPRNTGMTILAGKCCVSSDQRKPRLLMFLNHIADVPRLHRMTSRAIRTQLCFMNIRMARRAARIYACEFQVFVTTCAFDGFVLTFKRKTGLGMVK